MNECSEGMSRGIKCPEENNVSRGDVSKGKLSSKEPGQHIHMHHPDLHKPIIAAAHHNASEKSLKLHPSLHTLFSCCLIFIFSLALFAGKFECP